VFSSFNYINSYLFDCSAIFQKSKLPKYPKLSILFKDLYKYNNILVDVFLIFKTVLLTKTINQYKTFVDFTKRKKNVVSLESIFVKQVDFSKFDNFYFLQTYKSFVQTNRFNKNFTQYSFYMKHDYNFNISLFPEFFFSLNKRFHFYAIYNIHMSNNNRLNSLYLRSVFSEKADINLFLGK
jgi:hypothetical protein